MASLPEEILKAVKAEEELEGIKKEQFKVEAKLKNINKKMEEKITLKQAISKSWKEFSKLIPIILGTILLVSLASLIPKSFYLKIFQGTFLDPFIGALIGSISAGNPITSYIFGGEMIKQGVGLITVTTFIVSWVTVGLIQFPAESMTLGKKFALIRNISSFILAIIVGVLTAVLMNII